MNTDKYLLVYIQTIDSNKILEVKFFKDIEELKEKLINLSEYNDSDNYIEIKAMVEIKNKLEHEIVKRAVVCPVLEENTQVDYMEDD